MQDTPAQSDVPASPTFSRLEVLFGGNHRFYRHSLTLHSAFHSDLLCRVFVELGFVTFERIDALPDNEGILSSLLHAISQTIRIGLVLHHVSLAAHCVAHDSRQCFRSPDAWASIEKVPTSVVPARARIAFAEITLLIILSPFI